jgi:queuosine precursor transporter
MTRMTVAASVTARPARHYRYYDLIMAAFVAVLLCSNLIGPGKVCRFEWGAWLGLSTGVTFGAGNVFFPISYIFGDVLTEVYGYARARKVIWAGFAALAFAALMGYAVIHFPVDVGEPYNRVIQPALEVVFGNTWRIVIASMLGYWAGDFVNSYVLAKMKLLTKGRLLWTRTIGSTIVGQAVDSVIFYPLAFYGLWTPGKMVAVVIFNCIFKVGVEVVATPLTYLIINRLKRAENEDYYDHATNFTPFSLQD